MPNLILSGYVDEESLREFQRLIWRVRSRGLCLIDFAANRPELRFSFPNLRLLYMILQFDDVFLALS